MSLLLQGLTSEGMPCIKFLSQCATYNDRKNAHLNLLRTISDARCY